MEHFALNQHWFHLIYAGSAPAAWLLTVAKFAAKKLIYLFPLFLAYQWLVHPQRRGLVYMTAVALVLALAASYGLGQLFVTARPFVDGVGHNYLPHVADPSFPSDHMTFAATVAFCFMTQKPRWEGVILLLLTLVIGWARIFTGLHYPLDIAGGLALGFIATLICVLARKIIRV
jgi:undecaprenyl-diphosphatase